MNQPRFITKTELKNIAEIILQSHEVSPMSRGRMFEYAQEVMLENFGFTPKASATWVAVNMARNGWENVKQKTRAAIRSRRL